MRAAFVLAGTSPGGWHGERAYDIFDSKGILDAIASGIGATAPSFVTETYPELHPGRSAAVRVGETVIGLAGELHPRIARTLDLAGRVAVGEIDLEPLFASVAGRAALDLPRFPSADRDLAVVVSETTSAGDVTAAITQAAGETLESLTLFDVYRGEQIGAGNVSLAYRLAFRHPERTLTDEDVAGTMDSVLEAVRARGWRTRD
jgi:phenylalanyl-tRNA synthetase beta chain